MKRMLRMEREKRTKRMTRGEATVFKQEGQEYAQVMRMLDNVRCEAACIDGATRLCHIHGKMLKRVRIEAGDIILVGLRDYQDDEADVIVKLKPDEACVLKSYNLLPKNIRLNDEQDVSRCELIKFKVEDIDKL